jgi:hypothetical protein
MTIQPGRLVHISRHLVSPRQCQLKVGMGRDGVRRMLMKYPQCRLGIVLLDGEIGDHDRQTGNKDAFRIFGGEAGQQSFGIRELAGFHLRLGG